MKWKVKIGIQTIPVQPTLAQNSARLADSEKYISEYPSSHQERLKQNRDNIRLQVDLPRWTNTNPPKKIKKRPVRAGGTPKALKTIETLPNHF